MSPLPWERQEGEPAKAFTLFGLYRDMGPSRTLETVASGRREGARRASGYVSRLSRTWEWTSRATAWDEHQDQVAREAAERRAAQEGEARAAVFHAQQKRTLEVVDRLLDRIDAMLAFPVSRREVKEKVMVGDQEVPTLTVISPARWSWRDLAQMLYRLNQVSTNIVRPKSQDDEPPAPATPGGMDPQDLAQLMSSSPETLAKAKELAALLAGQGTQK